MVFPASQSLAIGVGVGRPQAFGVDFAAGEDQLLAFEDLDRLLELAYPYLGALEVLEDGDGAAGPSRGVPYVLDADLMAGVVAEGEVEAADVEPRFDEALQGLRFSEAADIRFDFTFANVVRNWIFTSMTRGEAGRGDGPPANGWNFRAFRSGPGLRLGLLGLLAARVEHVHRLAQGESAFFEELLRHHRGDVEREVGVGRDVYVAVGVDAPLQREAAVGRRQLALADETVFTAD
jgi:hypothetical protein